MVLDLKTVNSYDGSWHHHFLSFSIWWQQLNEHEKKMNEFKWCNKSFKVQKFTVSFAMEFEARIDEIT